MEGGYAMSDNKQTSAYHIGDRVKSSFLGNGIITDETEMDSIVIVHFDKAPSVGSMSENPIPQFISQLEKI